MGLRDYQKTAVRDVREAWAGGHQGVLLCMPTGTGKTYTMAQTLQREQPACVAVLAHTRPIVAQLRKACEQALGALNVGDSKDNCRVRVDTVQTRWPANWTPDIIVVDEAHRVQSRSYRELLEHRWPNARRLLLTATPDDRSDGQTFAGLASHLCRPIKVDEAIERGFLVPPRYFLAEGARLDELKRGRSADGYTSASQTKAFKGLTGNVLREWRLRCQGRYTAVFAPTVEVAEEVAAGFNEAGVPTLCLHGKTKDRERLEDAVRAGMFPVVVSVDVHIEGFDAPVLDAAMWLRKTASNRIWRQGNGRVIRSDRGKRDALIIDFAGNTFDLGGVEYPVTFDPFREAGEKAPGRDEIPPMGCCAQCFAAFPTRPRPSACPRCGAPLPVMSSRAKVQWRDGRFVEVDAPPPKVKVSRDWRLYRILNDERALLRRSHGWMFKVLDDLEQARHRAVRQGVTEKHNDELAALVRDRRVIASADKRFGRWYAPDGRTYESRWDALSVLYRRVT